MPSSVLSAIWDPSVRVADRDFRMNKLSADGYLLKAISRCSFDLFLVLVNVACMNRDDGFGGFAYALRIRRGRLPAGGQARIGLVNFQFLLGTGGQHGAQLLRIDAHPLANAPFRIRPFFLGAFHAPPHRACTLVFDYTQFFAQTHNAPPSRSRSSGPALHVAGLVVLDARGETWETAGQ